MTTKLSFKYLKPGQYKRIFKYSPDESTEALLRSNVAQRMMPILKKVEKLKAKLFAEPGQALSKSD